MLLLPLNMCTYLKLRKDTTVFKYFQGQSKWSEGLKNSNIFLALFVRKKGSVHNWLSCTFLNCVFYTLKGIRRFAINRFAIASSPYASLPYVPVRPCRFAMRTLGDQGACLHYDERDTQPRRVRLACASIPTRLD